MQRRIIPLAHSNQPIGGNAATGPEDWTNLAGAGVGVVRTEWVPLFQAAGLKTLEDFFQAKGEALSKPGLGKRYRARLKLGDGANGSTVYLKRYHGEKLADFLRRWVEDGTRNTPAHRDTQVAAALSRIGIQVPQTLAWGWTGALGADCRSFVVSAAVPGMPLDHWLRQGAFASLSFSQKLEALHGLITLARTFHEAGWCHRDFYLCHLFIEEQQGRFDFSLIDLQRVFRPRWRQWRWRIKDLAQLNYSTKPEYCTRAMRLRFILGYFGTKKLTPFHKRIIRKVVSKSARIARHDRS